VRAVARAALALAALAAALAAALLLSWLGVGPLAGPLYRDGPEALARAHPGAPTVVFVVLDTVRADRLSLCGYERPTSPTLESLRDRGAAWTCGAVTPGSWTLPSHASYFTGRPVVEHGAHALSRDGAALRQGTTERVRPLGPELPTLAETFSERGYQSLALSANPVIARASGLTRGFDHAVAAKSFGALPSQRIEGALKRNLRASLDPGRPLFLFLNLADAHQPFPATRAPWLKERASLRLYAAREGSIWRRWFRGRMTESQRRAFLAHLGDVYDQGVHDADAGLGRALEALEAYGWCRAGCRVVVTSDHGEFLGEQGLLDHGHYVYEANVRVPLLYWDSAGGAPALPSPISALSAYHLALDGRLPEPLPPVASAAWPHLERAEWSGGAAFTSTSAALWAGGEKLLWMDGEVRRYDLASDPGELKPLPAEGHPLLPALLTLAGAAVASDGDEAMDPAMRALLEAAGYVE
jgi:hypothetical protein